MAESLRTTWNGDEGHPSREDLLVFLDGELHEPEAALIGAHLDACWACRARREKIQETINLLADYHDQVFVPHSAPPPRGWRRFEALLSRLAEEGGRRSRLQQLLDSFGRAFSSLRRSVVPRPLICSRARACRLLNRANRRFNHCWPRCRSLNAACASCTRKRLRKKSGNVPAKNF